MRWIQCRQRRGFCKRKMSPVLTQLETLQLGPPSCDFSDPVSQDFRHRIDMSELQHTSGKVMGSFLVHLSAGMHTVTLIISRSTGKPACAAVRFMAYERSQINPERTEGPNCKCWRYLVVRSPVVCQARHMPRERERGEDMLSESS